MAKLLAVGIATLDIINSVDGFPAEDAEVRALSQRICRGGNATNTLVVASQLGHDCHWAGVLVDEPDARYIEADLQRYRINCDAVTRLDEGKVPTSYITHNLVNGSRTIVHYRDLPEYSYQAFMELDLSRFDWLHFEGRNVDDCARMLKLARRCQPEIPRSLEVEKDRPGIDELFHLADVLLFSKDFAETRGFNCPTDLLQHMALRLPQATLICAWGAAGAWARHGSNDYHCPAFPPPQVIDTLAAGDTFNAGIIDALLKECPLEQALADACRLAGAKCGRLGLELGPDINIGITER